jgi:rare lipoprotein A
MRRVAGVFPLKVNPATWFAAVVVASVWVAAALYVADHIVSSNAPGSPRGATIATEPTQIPNRAARAAREVGKKQVLLDPEVVVPRPEIVTPLPEDDGEQDPPVETGRASWYDLDSQTASGEAMDASALTAAHPSLPLGTQVRVANLDNGRAVVVCINDRGPFAKNRIIDLSRAAAEQLDMIDAGVARVRVTPVAGVVASNVKASGEMPPLQR